MTNKRYYIGLDVGTSSVGWAVTDEEYNLLRKKGHSLWGARLFDEAETAAERRMARSTRRRTRRAKSRLKLLRMLFSEEITKVDPDFYIRLRESFYLEEDKNFYDKAKVSKNTLFNDIGFKDKDFHKKYPTIWHLRRELMRSSGHDIRLYFLAIQHILKHRGHFLREGNLNSVTDFSSVWLDFVDKANELGFQIDESTQDSVEQIIKNEKREGKRDRAKALKELIFIEDEVKNEFDESALAGLLIGSKVSLTKMFGNTETEEYKFSFDEGVFEDKLPEIEQAVGAENTELIVLAKQVFDYGFLSKLLGDNQYISDAMISNYNKHQDDLKLLKQALRPFADDYMRLFKIEKLGSDKDICYAAYIGRAYTENKDGRRKHCLCSQEDLNKEIKKMLEKHNIEGYLLDEAAAGTLLPKQRGQAKGTIPQQLHHEELKLILQNLSKDYPSFSSIVANEDEKYNTKAKKIALIHNFRVPYYCGPLVKRKFDVKGNEINSGRNASVFSWADSEIKELVYPWNFAKIVDLDARANNFIRRMTNECTYLIGEDVLPKSSLRYQKYMVFNQLNSLRINGEPISADNKNLLFERVFEGNEISGNITLRRLKKYLVENNIYNADVNLSENTDLKILPRLKTHQDFLSILGKKYLCEYKFGSLEKVVELITILGNEKMMLARKIEAELGCSEEQAKKLAKKNYSDWGRLSNKFLDGIRATAENREMTILEALEETNYTLMELLSQNFDFAQRIEECNNLQQPSSPEPNYEDVKVLYCSPAVKRSVWQTIKIVQELKQVIGAAPAKIFLEVTRGDEEKGIKGIKLSRKKNLHEQLKSIKSNEARELLEELDSKEDRDLQSKKLFLYFSQMGRCAYTGERIELRSLMTDAYDIDHIYPRSLTKDDSITRNLALVKAEFNRTKTDTYPLDPSWQSHMMLMWVLWKNAGLITAEKFNRLIRKTPLTDDELSNFIARQIVETSQSVKAIRELLKKYYPETKIILVKAGQVSDFRHIYGRKSPETSEYQHPEFVKVRALNDFHHAKDAYLNIVVGNVMSSTFTDNPLNFVRNKQDRKYSIRPELLFRAKEVYKSRLTGKNVSWPQMKGWRYQDSLQNISKTLKRNDVLWTKMPFEQSGAISDLMIVGKSTKNDGILPIRRDKRLEQVEKYGGYNSISGAYFALIEQGERRLLIQVPIIAKNTLEEYVSRNYLGASIIIPRILFKSYIKINGFPAHIAGRTGNNLLLHPAFQLVLDDVDAVYLKNIIKITDKMKSVKNYVIDEEKDDVSRAKNEALFDSLADKLRFYKNAPTMGSKVEEIISCRDAFLELDLTTQAMALKNLQAVMACNAIKGDLSTFVSKAGAYGGIQPNNNVSNFDSFKMILQSPTGLRTKEIDLKTITRAEADKIFKNSK